MSIKQHPDKDPILPPPPPAWGLLAAKGDMAAAVRFILGNRSVSFPYHTLARWEHSAGNPESLTVRAGKELITVTGRSLAVLRDALDEGMLLQIRMTPARYADVRSGTQVSSITINPAEDA